MSAWTPDDRRRLASIRERLAKATQAPWCWEPVGEKSNEWVVGVALDEQGHPVAGRLDDPEGLMVADQEVAHGNGYFADADFIAHAPDDMAWLLARIAPPTAPEGGATALESREALIRAAADAIAGTLQKFVNVDALKRSLNNYDFHDDFAQELAAAEEYLAAYRAVVAPAPPLSPTPEGASAEPGGGAPRFPPSTEMCCTRYRDTGQWHTDSCEGPAPPAAGEREGTHEN